MRKSTSFLRLVESKDISEVGDRDEILQKHIEERALTRLVAVLFARAKPEDQLCKHLEIVVVHGTGGATNGVEFSTTLWLAAVADSGGGGAHSEGFGKKDSTLMEVEVFVGDVVPVVADNPAFDGVGCCTPFVNGGGEYLKAARMWEVQCHFNVVGVRSLVVWSGGSVCIGGKKRRAILSG